MSGLAIGAFSVGRVTELEFPAFPAMEFFPAATPEMVERARRELPGRIGSDGKIVMSFHSFVLKTGRYTIVIDTCCAKSRPGRGQFDQGKRDFLGDLAALGVTPEQVTHVMCTHSHWDHVGWNTRRVDGQWVPTFVNAKYIMAKREYDHWNAVYADQNAGSDAIHAMAFEDSVQPIMRAERAVLVEDDFELDTGVSLEPCHGHTPGHVVVNVASQGRKGVFIGDAIHHAMQLLFPELLLTRRRRYERLARDATRLDRKARGRGHGRHATPFRDTVLRHHREGRRWLPRRFHPRIVMSSEATGGGPTRRVAEFVAGLRFEALPDIVVAQACNVVLDTVGCALGAWRDDPPRADIARRLALSFAARPVASVWGGTGARSDPALAALANGILANAADFDDTHKRALIHTGSMIGALSAEVSGPRDGDAAKRPQARGHAALSQGRSSGAVVGIRDRGEVP